MSKLFAFVILFSFLCTPLAFGGEPPTKHTGVELDKEQKKKYNEIKKQKDFKIVKAIWPELQKSFIGNRPISREVFIKLGIDPDKKQLERLKNMTKYDKPVPSKDIAGMFREFAKDTANKQRVRFGIEGDEDTHIKTASEAIADTFECKITYMQDDFESGKINGQTFENIFLFLKEQHPFYGLCEYDEKIVYVLIRDLCTVPGDSPLGKKVNFAMEAIEIISKREKFKAVRENWIAYLNYLADSKTNRQEDPRAPLIERSIIERPQTAFEYQIEIYSCVSGIERMLNHAVEGKRVKLRRSDKFPDLAKLPTAKPAYDKNDKTDKLLLKMQEKHPEYAKLIDLFADNDIMLYRYGGIGDEAFSDEEWIFLLERLLLPEKAFQKTPEAAPAKNSGVELDKEQKKKYIEIKKQKDFKIVKSIWPELQKSFIGNRPISKDALKKLGIDPTMPQKEKKRLKPRLDRPASPQFIAGMFRSIAEKIARKQLYRFGIEGQQKGVQLALEKNEDSAKKISFNNLLQTDFESGTINGQTLENIYLFIKEKPSLTYFCENDTKVAYTLLRELCKVDDDSPRGEKANSAMAAIEIISKRERFKAIRENWIAYLNHLATREHHAKTLQQSANWLADRKKYSKPETDFDWQITAYRNLQYIETELEQAAKNKSIKLGRSDKFPDLDKLPPVNAEYDKNEKADTIFLKLREKHPEYTKLIDIFTKGGAMKEKAFCCFFIGEEPFTEDEWIFLLERLLLPEQAFQKTPEAAPAKHSGVELDKEQKKKYNRIKKQKDFKLVQSIWPELQKSFIGNRPISKDVLKKLGINLDTIQGSKINLGLKSYEDNLPPDEIAGIFHKFAKNITYNQLNRFGIKGSKEKIELFILLPKLLPISKSVYDFLLEDFEADTINGQTFENILLFLHKKAPLAYLGENDIKIAYVLLRELCNEPGDSPLGEKAISTTEAIEIISKRECFKAIRENWLAYLNFIAKSKTAMSSSKIHCDYFRRTRISPQKPYDYQAEAYYNLMYLDNVLQKGAKERETILGRNEKFPDLAKLLPVEPDYNINEKADSIFLKLREKHPEYANLIDTFTNGGVMKEKECRYVFIGEEPFTEDEWIFLLERLLLPEENAEEQFPFLMRETEQIEELENILQDRLPPAKKKRIETQLAKLYLKRAFPLPKSFAKTKAKEYKKALNLIVNHKSRRDKELVKSIRQWLDDYNRTHPNQTQQVQKPKDISRAQCVTKKDTLLPIAIKIATSTFNVSEGHNIDIRLNISNLAGHDITLAQPSIKGMTFKFKIRKVGEKENNSRWTCSVEPYADPFLLKKNKNRIFHISLFEDYTHGFGPSWLEPGEYIITVIYYSQNCTKYVSFESPYPNDLPVVSNEIRLKISGPCKSKSKMIETARNYNWCNHSTWKDYEKTYNALIAMPISKSLEKRLRWRRVIAMLATGVDIDKKKIIGALEVLAHMKLSKAERGRIFTELGEQYFFLALETKDPDKQLLLFKSAKKALKKAGTFRAKDLLGSINET